MRRTALPLYLAPAIAVYGIFVLWPLGRLLALSLVRWDGYSAPVFVGWGNYAALWGEPAFLTEAAHSLVWLTVTLVVPVAAGLFLALLLASAPRPLRAVLRATLLVPLLVPAAVVAVAWRLVYNPLSGPLTGLLHAVGFGALTGDWLGDPRLALPALLVPACWASFGLSMLVFEAAVGGISPAVMDAAQVDGAGAWARLRAVTLPALRGAWPLATVATALCAVPSLDLVLLTTNGGPGYATTTLTLDMYGRAFGMGQVGVGAALGCVQSLAGVAITLVAVVAVLRRAQAGEADEAVERGAMYRGHAGRAPSGALLLLGAVLVLAPVAWLAALAAQDPALTAWRAVWAHIGAAWGDGLGPAFGISLLIALPVAMGTVSLAVPAAFGLHRIRSGGVRLAIIVALALGLFQPSAILIIPLFDLLKAWGLLNTPAGIVLPEIGRTLPFAVLVLFGSLRGLPADVLDAASLDGPPLQALRHVALPLIAPMAAVVAVWAFLSSWGEYLLPTVVLQDESLQTVPTALAHFVGRIDTEYGLVAAGALASVVPLLALYAASYGVMARGVRRLWRAG